MKALVVYYSRTGLTRKVADKLAVELGADKEEIIDKTNRMGVMGYIRSGKEAYQKILADIEAPKINPSNYDLVIVGTPVWAATMSSPVRAYLTAQKDKIKRAAFFATQGGSSDCKALNHMADLAGLKSSGSFVASSKEVVKDDYRAKLSQFVKIIRE